MLESRDIPTDLVQLLIGHWVREVIQQVRKKVIHFENITFDQSKQEYKISTPKADSSLTAFCHFGEGYVEMQQMAWKD